ncbi:hypothetical protein JCM3774_001375 [Rhodotorula dairenensis]
MRPVQLHGGVDHDMPGMDMGMSNSTTAMHMATAFTTSLGGANLWFSGWTPTSAGATFAACLGLAALAVLSRLLSAVKVCAEIAWAKHLYESQVAIRGGAIALPSETEPEPEPKSRQQDNVDEDDQAPSYIRTPDLTGGQTLPSTPRGSRRALPMSSPPFSLAIDLPRAVLFGLQAFIAYLLMLAVMSYNAYFFVAILVGLMLGELAFGRYIALLGAGAEAHGGHGFSGVH